MSEDGLLEEDIWEYKGIKKIQSASQNSEIISEKLQKGNDRHGRSQSRGNRSKRKTSKEKTTPKKQRPKGKQSPDQHCIVSVDVDHVAQSQENVSSTSTKRKKNCKEQSLRDARPLYEGYCPSCQMPFSLLLVETPRWHVTECLDDSKPSEKGIIVGGGEKSFFKWFPAFLSFLFPDCAPVLLREHFPSFIFMLGKH